MTNQPFGPHDPWGPPPEPIHDPWGFNPTPAPPPTPADPAETTVLLPQQETVSLPAATPPGIAPIVVVTLFLGLFGMIPASSSAALAARDGFDTGRYWKAFAVTFAAGLVLVVIGGSVGWMALQRNQPLVAAPAGTTAAPFPSGSPTTLTRTNPAATNTRSSAAASPDPYARKTGSGTYTNVRFGYTCPLPATYTWEESDNSAAISATDPSGRAKVGCSAGNNVTGETAASSFREAKERL